MTAAQKTAARKALAVAVRYGRVVPPAACESCGATGSVQGHHADYSRPLDVSWLCGTCHRAEHAGDDTRRGRRPSEARTPEEAAPLAAAESAYRAAEEVASAARIARNDAVRAALAAGWTHQQISDVTGLSRGRIGQIGLSSENVA